MSTSLNIAPSPDLPARIICVLGMHRSGTSCLTGSLQEAGLFLGDCHTWNPYNQKGNRENQRIVDINDAVLAANGGAWDRLPERFAWPEAQVLAVREFLGQYAGCSNFGFKDPRTLLVIDGWKQLCPQLEFVGIFRHPNQVANSLEKRSEMPREAGLALWYQYNRRLLAQHAESPFPLLCFDDDPAAFQRKLTTVIRSLALGGSAAAPGFFDADLKTVAEASDRGLPWRVRRLYKKLRRLAVQG